MSQRRGGIIHVEIDGVTYDAKTAFKINLGNPERKTVAGVDSVHGFTEAPKPAFIEGAFTDRGDLSLRTLANMVDVTVSVEQANGKVATISHAWYVGEGTVETDEGEIGVRFESKNPGQET